MISQKSMKEWYPSAVDSFKSQMPSMDVPYPQIYIVSNKIAAEKRRHLVQALDSPLINEVGKSYMELIHGNLGDAVLIYQSYFRGWRLEIDDQKTFNHFLWHELGHFFAIYNENKSENYFRFMDQKPHPEEYDEMIGYLFWSEFIAEVIACKISPEPTVDLEKDDWLMIHKHLVEYLNGAFHRIDNDVDFYDLAFYFAKVLADKKTISFINAAKNGALIIENHGYGLIRRMYEEAGTDPYGLKFVDECYLQSISELKEYLQGLLSNHEYWHVTMDDLYEIGRIIHEMRFRKKWDKDSVSLRDRIYR